MQDDKSPRPKKGNESDIKSSPGGDNQFLQLLRASDGGFSLEKNDVTVRASNVASHQRATSALPGLFAPPESPAANPPVASSGGEEKIVVDDESEQKPTASSAAATPVVHASISSPTPLQPRTKLQDDALPPRPKSNSLDRNISGATAISDAGDSPLHGEAIALGGHESAGIAHGLNARTAMSALSPRTRQRVVESFLHHPSNNEGLPRPPAMGGKDRAVSFDPHAKQNDQSQSRPNNPSVVDVPLRRRLPSDSRVINLDDILTAGPYEVEAETNILKALEEQPSHRRFRSETSTILSYVPDNMGHDFSDEDYDEMEKVGSLEDGLNSFEAATSSGKGHGSAENKDIEQAIPFLKAEKKRHRRNMSVEDRLAGLATEFYKLDGKQGDNKNKTDLRLDNRPLENVSSADAFRNNAALVSNSEDSSSLTSKARVVDMSPPLSRVEEGNEDEQSNDNTDSSNQDNHYLEPRLSRRSRMLAGATDTLKDDWEIWRSFFNPRKEHIAAYTKTIFVFLGVPLIAVAVILFYGFENPPTGFSSDGSPGNRASASWWLLFGFRQTLTLSLALLLQMLFVDFLSIGTRVMLKLVGPILTLLIVQSKGWPFVCFCWSLLDFGLLFGNRPVARHWLHWQTYVGLFNSQNPSGQVVDSFYNKRVLTIFACVSVVVAIKRFVVGLYLSRNTFKHYGDQLAKIISKMILVTQVSQLAKKLDKSSRATMKSLPAEASTLAENATLKRIYSLPALNVEGSDVSSVKSEVTEMRSVHTKKLTETLDDTNKMRLLQLLENWEEPESLGTGIPEYISISAVLRFRNALNMVNNDHAFSLSFGPTHTRDACIESSQHTYARLLSSTPEELHVHFETLGLIAVDATGNIDEEKAKELVKVFRPRRDGILTMLDFVKSVDSVYKEFRLLQASIQNSSQIDRAFENLINVIFYTVVVTIILFLLGFDPLSFFLSLTSIILAFAFMIGSASSKYFEGIVFILVRRPYDIGDIVHFSQPESETNLNGSLGWIVQQVTLFETVGTWVPTMERASFNNGSLASSQIINWARSPNAKINVQLHFPIETKYEQIDIFKRAIEEYMRVRPREWLQLNGFRVNRIFTEQSYMQVTLLMQHREPWQSIGQILDSKANLVTYCNEVQKKLGMQYRAPPLPVDLNGAQQFLENASSLGSVTGGPTILDDDDADMEAKMNQFRHIAKTRHQLSASNRV